MEYVALTQSKSRKISFSCFLRESHDRDDDGHDGDARRDRRRNGLKESGRLKLLSLLFQQFNLVF
jgi:hypothetical protein